MKNLTKTQLEILKETIDKHLELRCIKVKTSLTQYKTDSGMHRFSLTSTSFQTVPVLHQNLRVLNFGGSMCQDVENKNIINIWIRVHAQYDGNGVSLFEVNAMVTKDDPNNLHIRRVEHGKN